MKTKHAIMSLSIALSLGVVSTSNAALIGKAVEKSYKTYEATANKSGEISAVLAHKESFTTLKGAFAKRINTNVLDVNKLISQKTNENGLRSFALMKIKDYDKNGTEVNTGIDTLEAMNTVAKEIQTFKNEVKTIEDKTELASLQRSMEVIAEFSSTVGELGTLGMVSADGSTPVIAKEAMETLIKILPDVLVKFEGSRRNAYTEVIAKINELIRSGKMAPADALKQVLNDDKKLEALRGCKL